jgi:hypothetical protein
LASLALSDNPFSAWESWLCKETEKDNVELPVHKTTWGCSQSKRPPDPECLASSDASCLRLGHGANICVVILVLMASRLFP